MGANFKRDLKMLFSLGFWQVYFVYFNICACIELDFGVVEVRRGLNRDGFWIC